MKIDEIRKLVEVSEEIAAKIFDGYPDSVERQLKAIDSVSGLQLLKSILQREAHELKAARIPEYAGDIDKLENYLSVQTSEFNTDVIFRPWYDSFLVIEKDNAYLHDILRLEPQLIEDAVFMHERGHYEYGRDPNYGGYPLTATSFYWNVHVLVLAYIHLKKSRLSFIESRIREYTNVGNGLQSYLNQEQKRILFSKLKAAKYIHERTTEENFVAALTPDPLPYRFEKVKWILIGKMNEPHKTAFREFLELYCKHDQHDTGKAPSQHDINRVFEDRNGDPIILIKRTKLKPSNFLLEMEGFLR